MTFLFSALALNREVSAPFIGSDCGGRCVQRNGPPRREDLAQIPSSGLDCKMLVSSLRALDPSSGRLKRVIRALSIFIYGSQKTYVKAWQQLSIPLISCEDPSPCLIYLLISASAWHWAVQIRVITVIKEAVFLALQGPCLKWTICVLWFLKLARRDGLLSEEHEVHK